MNREVRLFDGTKTRIVCEDDDLVDTLNRVMIEPFKEALDMAWLTNNQAEVHAKNYLAQVAALMITAPSKHNIQGERATRRINARETLVRDVDDCAGKPPSKVATQKSKLGSTTLAILQSIRALHPNARLCWVRMDTEGYIEYQGRQYQFDDPRYAPVKKRGFGDYYKFDRVLILDNSELQFFDQNITEILPIRASAEIAA